MDVPNWDLYRRSVLDIADLVERRLPLLTSRDDLAARQCAAAYLARCRRLLLGMDLLAPAAPDLVGVLLRPMFEAWLFGTWLLLEADEALPALVNDYKVEVEKMARLAGLNLADVDETWKADLRCPTVAALAVKVGHLLTAAGDAGGRHVGWSYDVVFRGESLRSVHGGLGAIISHLADGGERLEVVETRRDVGDASGLVLWAGVLLAIFARRVFCEFGVGVQDLDRLAAPLERLADEMNATASG